MSVSESTANAWKPHPEPQTSLGLTLESTLSSPSRMAWCMHLLRLCGLLLDGCAACRKLTAERRCIRPIDDAQHTSLPAVMLESPASVGTICTNSARVWPKVTASTGAVHRRCKLGETRQHARIQMPLVRRNTDSCRSVLRELQDMFEMWLPQRDSCIGGTDILVREVWKRLR